MMKLAEQVGTPVVGKARMNKEQMSGHICTYSSTLASY
jgi:hypothetical protein